MAEKTAATVALVQLLADVNHLRALVDVIALTASVCVVRPQGTEPTMRLLPPVRVRQIPGPGAPVTEVVVVGRGARREPPEYDPDEAWGSLDHWDEEITEPPTPRLRREDSIP